MKNGNEKMRSIPSIAAMMQLVIVSLLLSACDGSSNTPAQTQTITGAAVSGPLVNATVSVYSYDSSQPDFRGPLIVSGSTDASAAIIGLDLPLPLTPPYIIEFTSTPGNTFDLDTGAYPVIPTLSTLVTQSLIDSGEPIYATVLTTLALSIAIENVNSGISASDYEASLSTAAQQVVNSVGFGMSADFDIFATPALLDNSVDTAQEQADVLAYRSAIEALVAIMFLMEADASTTASAEEIFIELAIDASDGVIDANVNGILSTVYNSTTLALFMQDPTTLLIPNSPNNQTVAQVTDILIAEIASTGSTASTAELSNGSVTVVLSPASTSTANKADWDLFSWNDGSVWR